MKKKYIVILVIVAIVGAMFGIRYYNLNVKQKPVEEQKDNEGTTEEGTEPVEEGKEGDTTETKEDTTYEQTPADNKVGSTEVESYVPSVGLHTDKVSANNRVEVDDSLDASDLMQKTPNYPAVCKLYGKTKIPPQLKGYGDKANLADFNTSMATELTSADLLSNTQYLVGLEQNKKDLVDGKLKSLSWLIDNSNSLSESNALKFVDLKVIKTLGDNAILCGVDFSEDCVTNRNLVCLVDTSGTLDMPEYYPGATFSCVVYAHNIVVSDIGMDTVVTIYFDTFKE